MDLKENKTTFIYVLIDPRNNQIRYVGKSDNPTARFRNHICNENAKHNKTKNEWIKELKLENSLPVLKVIEECLFDIWPEREIYWIDYYKSLGCNLTNLTIGGGSIVIVSESTKIKLSQIKTGRKLSEETKEKISIANKKYTGEQTSRWGQKLSDETLEKMRKKHSNSSSDYFGVSWDKTHKRWISTYHFTGRNVYIGRFKNEAEAAKAYDFYVLSHNIPAKLNFGCDL